MSRLRLEWYDPNLRSFSVANSIMLPGPSVSQGRMQARRELCTDLKKGRKRVEMCRVSGCSYQQRSVRSEGLQHHSGTHGLYCPEGPNGHPVSQRALTGWCLNRTPSTGRGASWCHSCLPLRGHDSRGDSGEPPTAAVAIANASWRCVTQQQ